jgi:hypothetical protein
MTDGTNNFDNDAPTLRFDQEKLEKIKKLKGDLDLKRFALKSYWETQTESLQKEASEVEKDPMYIELKDQVDRLSKRLIRVEIGHRRKHHSDEKTE